MEGRERFNQQVVHFPLEKKEQSQSCNQSQSEETLRR